MAGEQRRLELFNVVLTRGKFPGVIQWLITKCKIRQEKRRASAPSSQAAAERHLEATPCGVSLSLVSVCSAPVDIYRLAAADEELLVSIRNAREKCRRVADTLAPGPPRV